MTDDMMNLRTGGVFGGDLIQRVLNHSRQLSGTILWECKRTKAWNDRWLIKARADQRAAKADVGLRESAVSAKEAAAE